ncbi:MAG TPA: hypothetical protein VFX61_10210 [Micromonosporaceae bacterium]|nr:hypothetical protein [Micromonosporaceae bacterium]
MGNRAEAAAVLRCVIGRECIAVTEARYWYGGRREGDAESLLHCWLHFQDTRPLMVHGSGERLFLKFGEPYPPYDMGEHGETRVGPARAPDLLASLPGHRLLNATLVQGFTTGPSVGGVLLRFDHVDLVLASLADEWVLRRGEIPRELAPYLSLDYWLDG